MTKKTENETLVTWDSFVSEAKRPVIKVKVSDTKTITIPQPSGKQVLDAEDMMMHGAPARKQLANICGEEAFEDLLPLFEDAPGGAIAGFLSAVMKHYGVEAPSQ